MMQFVPSYNCINRKSIYVKDFLNNNQWEIMSKYSYLVQLIATIICYHVLLFNVSSNDIKIFDTLFCILLQQNITYPSGKQKDFIIIQKNLKNYFQMFLLIFYTTKNLKWAIPAD